VKGLSGGEKKRLSLASAMLRFQLEISRRVARFTQGCQIHEGLPDFTQFAISRRVARFLKQFHAGLPDSLTVARVHAVGDFTQGCQIFLDTIYTKTGKIYQIAVKLPNANNKNQLAVIYSKWP
jgi:hypothetical protein